MHNHHDIQNAPPRPAASWPPLMRAAVIGGATLILCSCRGPQTAPHSAAGLEILAAAEAPHTLPEGSARVVATDWPQTLGPVSSGEPCDATSSGPFPFPPGETGLHTACPDCAVCEPGPPPAHEPPESWRPPGLVGPWPASEYVCDGGDTNEPAGVRADWSAVGLEPEETIAHYDTLDGRRVVRPTNRVCIYAPRFAAVRRVHSPRAHQGQRALLLNERKLGPLTGEQTSLATTAVQPLQPIGETGTRGPSIYRGRAQAGATEVREIVAQFYGGLLPHENFCVIRLGSYDASQKARLARHVTAALTWSKDEQVHVTIDSKPAVALTVDRGAASVHRVVGDGSSELRIVKVASTDNARPGETVEFTLRLDNTGEEPVGNVTVLDNLSPRLEYVRESSQATLKAELVVEPNQAGSQILRWEITEPIPPGDGGIIRFRCRVR